MGSVIQAVEQSKTKPVSTWRLTYSARLTWHTLLALLDEMLDYGFISLVDAQTVHRKRGPRRFGEVGLINTPSARFIETTAKGRKFLAITQAMATLMPTAPWLADD